jgi:PKD repeat protein
LIQGNSVVWHTDTSDIFLYNIPSNTLTQITADGTGTNQATPDIYTTTLVWKDDGFSMLPGFGIYDIAYSELDPPLTERITDADTTAFIPADANWRPRITSDDRVIWEDQRDDAPTYAATQIYMFSRNVNEPCLADFTAPSAGSRNTPISFTDASTGNIDQWVWDFGDGSSSTDQNPAHTYATSGTYPVTLTVSNPYCRSRTAAWPIVVDRMPQASFAANITTGMVPLAVRFTNTSRGWQTGLDWDFGDGVAVNSTETNPVHTYTTGGTYTVLLFASNTYGTGTERKNSFIHALSGGTMTLSSDITGITITPAGDHEQLSFDTTIITDYLFDPANNTVLTCVPPPGNGISQITFFSPDGTGFTQTGPLISGVVSRTNIMSDLLPLTDFTDPSLGTLSSVNYTLDYSGYPALATVTTEVYDDTLPDYGLISTTMHSNGFTSANGIPYIIRFRKTNLDDPFRATIRMSVDSAWTAAHGWRTDHINTFRITDDELYGEILPAAFVMHDAGNNLDYYMVSSPHGLSKFAFSDLSGTGNLFQMAYLGVTEHFSGPSSDSDSATGTTGQGLTSQQNQPQLNEPQLNPPQSAATSVDLYINNLGVITQTSILKSSDQLAAVAIGQGVTALDANGNPLSSISIEPVSADDIAGMPSAGDLSFGGLAFNLQPEGAVFSPAITITFNVPDARWSQQYTIQEFDRKASTWVDLPTTYNPETGTVSASVSHFCTIALFTSGIPAVSGTPAQLKTMAAPPEPIPTPAASSQIGILYNMAAFVTGLVIRNIYIVTIIIAIAVIFYLRGRRGRLDKIRYNL